MNKHLYDTEQEAFTMSKKIGCPRGVHKHGRKFMPCKTHKEYENRTNNTSKKELEELIDYDGTMTNSKIPILDPHLHPKKTTDQTVAMSRVVQDPRIRGFRTYFGENTKEKNITEEDMADAFGYEETQFMDAEETIKFLEKELGLEPEDAEGRAKEFGKEPKRDENSEYKDKKGFVGRPILKEKSVKTFTKEQILKMSEDLLVNKNDDIDVQEKDKSVSDIIQRNIQVLKKQAKAEGISSSQLIKMFRSE